MNSSLQTKADFCLVIKFDRRAIKVVIFLLQSEPNQERLIVGLSTPSNLSSIRAHNESDTPEFSVYVQIDDDY